MFFTNLSCLRTLFQSIALVCLVLFCQNVASIFFCEVNSNGRCSPFVCCICFVKLPCLSRYTVDCSVWNVSCTCVSARLYFVTEDDLLKSSFTFFLATSRQLFHSYTQFNYIDSTFRVSNFMLSLCLIRPCTMSSRGSDRGWFLPS